MCSNNIINHWASGIVGLSALVKWPRRPALDISKINLSAYVQLAHMPRTQNYIIANKEPLYSCAVELIFSMRVNAGQKENTHAWASRGRCTFIYRAALFFIFLKDIAHLYSITSAA